MDPAGLLKKIKKSKKEKKVLKVSSHAIEISDQALGDVIQDQTKGAFWASLELV